MRTGKVLLVMVAFAAVLGLGVSAEAADYPLYAGQDILVGTVSVTNDGPDVTVKLATTGWCMTEAHVQIGEPIPQKNGNPIPGKFEFKDEFPCVYEVQYTDTVSGPSVQIAAHAVVWNEASSATVNVVSHVGTPIINVNGLDVGQEAVAAKEPVNYPNCASYTEDTDNSVWDSNIGSTFFNAFQAVGADWIWDSPHPIHPRTGDIVTFEETFSVPGLPVSADLLITADNAFKVELNGSFVGQSVSLGPGFPDTLREQMIAAPQDDDWGVASQGWQRVEVFGLGIGMGENTLTITAANEYMCNGYSENCASGADRYYGWNNTTKTYTSQIFNDPLPGDGMGVQPCVNPGALIFAAMVDYYAQEETAWGADGSCEFDGRNWATCIEYELEFVQ